MQQVFLSHLLHLHDISASSPVPHLCVWLLLLFNQNSFHVVWSDWMHPTQIINSTEPDQSWIDLIDWFRVQCQLITKYQRGHLETVLLTLWTLTVNQIFIKHVYLHYLFWLLKRVKADVFWSWTLFYLIILIIDWLTESSLYPNSDNERKHRHVVCSRCASLRFGFIVVCLFYQLMVCYQSCVCMFLSLS